MHFDAFMQLPDETGFTVIEVLVAMVIVTIVALGVAQLVTVALVAAQAARSMTTCTTLAVQKMEQLKALTWGFAADDVAAPPVSDTTTDLSCDPPQGGGVGLAVSPADSLDRNTAGYVDFVDATGRWVGTGTTPPASAAFVRRWSVEALPADPPDTLILQVFVTRAAVDRRVTLAAGDRRAVLLGDALLSTIVTRREP